MKISQGNSHTPYNHHRHAYKTLKDVGYEVYKIYVTGLKNLTFGCISMTQTIHKHARPPQLPSLKTCDT
jgi:hypothetical protein